MSAMAALLQITTIATFWTLSHQKDSPAEFINCIINKLPIKKNN